MLPRGRTPITIFPSTDALARWWADRRLLTLSVSGVEGAHRALELLFVQRPELRPIAPRFRRLVVNWCKRTGGENLMEGRVQFITFWTEFLAERGLFVGDVVSAAVARQIAKDASSVAAPYVRSNIPANQRMWRRKNEISKRHRALSLIGLPDGRYFIDVVSTRVPTEHKKAKSRARARKWYAKNRENVLRQTSRDRKNAARKAKVVSTRERVRRARKEGRTPLRREVGAVSWVAIN